MRMPGKTQHNSHCSYSPNCGASVRLRAPVDGAHYDNFATNGKPNCVQILRCGAPSRGANATLFHPGTRRDTRADTATHCVSGMPARSISLRRGGRLSWANRARCRQRGLGEREERLFFESRRARRHLDLVSRALRFGPTSPRPFSLSVSAAPSAQPISTSAAIASLLMKRSWSCSTNYGRASGRDETPERKITASSRRSVAGVGTDGAASASASQPSYSLAPGDPASVQWGGLGRERARTAGIIQGRAA